MELLTALVSYYLLLSEWFAKEGSHLAWLSLFMADLSSVCLLEVNCPKTLLTYCIL